MRIVVVGAGYVGLVTAACFAAAGHALTCIDIDRAKIEKLKHGILPIYEPELQEIVSANLDAGRLKFSSSFADVRMAEAIFIAVGTPTRRGDGRADLSQVNAAAAALTPFIAPGTVVVLKSTVPVGTCDEIESIIARARPELDFHVVSNPEFLRAGAAVQDFVSPDRVVIGAEEEQAREKMAEIYQPVFADTPPIVHTSRRSSELIKYASNAFLATKIAFINEVANLCERVGADALDVSRAMGLDRRIGPQFLSAGPGFGGSCFPKDTLALVKAGEDYDVTMRIAEAVVLSNAARKRAIARKIAAAMGGSLRQKTVALLGLTFKPDTDDMREAPSINLADGLSDLHARVRAYDPAGMSQAKALLPPDIVNCSSEYEAAEGADAVVLVTEWKQFRDIDFDRLKAKMRSPIMIDLRNIYSAEDLTARGFCYYRIGAPQMRPAISLDQPRRRAEPSQQRRLRLAKPALNGGGRRGQRRNGVISEVSSS